MPSESKEVIVEQLNILGKRSGAGFVAHKATLVNALSRALASRVELMDLTIGRKGLLGYLKALGGSNVVKVTPSNGSASESQAIGKRLKVTCGANTSSLNDGLWLGEKTPMTFCEVRISQNNAVKPNIGAGEVAEALARVLPFTATDDNRPVLQCVNFVAGDGKLTLVGADGFRLAVIRLDYDDGGWQVLISRDDLKGVANALKRAKRANISVEEKADGDGGLMAKYLVIDADLIRYRWPTAEGNFPDWEKLIPTEHTTFAQFDTVEALKAVSSLKALADAKDARIDLTFGDGKLIMANADEQGQAEMEADTLGDSFISVNGAYLTDALKACGGMADFSMSSPSAPMLFSADGFQLVVMPMMSPKAEERQTAQAETSEAEPAEPQSKPEAEAEPVTASTKGKRSKAKQPVTA